jgi:hypothetical protein
MSNLKYCSKINIQGKNLCKYLLNKNKIDYFDHELINKQLDDKVCEKEAYMHLLRKLLNDPNLPNLFDYSFHEFLKHKSKIHENNLGIFDSLYIDFVEQELYYKYKQDLSKEIGQTIDFLLMTDEEIEEYKEEQKKKKNIL